MKALFVTFLISMVLIPGLGRTEDASEAQKKECFKKHSQLMSKPALMTIQRCWDLHGYLMTRGS